MIKRSVAILKTPLSVSRNIFGPKLNIFIAHISPLLNGDVGLEPSALVDLRG
jgi:hypothetical protein